MSQGNDFGSARTFDAALDQLAEATGALGFDSVDYGFMPQARAADGRYHAPTIVSRRFPRRWLQGWAPFQREDPLLYGAYPRTLPLDWKDIADAPWLKPIQREAFGYIRGLGFADGVTVPIHLPDNAFAFVTVATREQKGAWRERKAEVMDRLFVLAHAFHASQGGHWSVQALQPQILSAREQLVLALAAAGLNARQTASRIHRSVETVRRQRKAAMHKLSARTMAQAVAQAMQRGSLGMTQLGN
jgi:LuxR family transcriptional regulator